MRTDPVVKDEPTVYGPPTYRYEVDYSTDTSSRSDASNPGDTSPKQGDGNDEKVDDAVPPPPPIPALPNDAAKIGDMFKQEHRQLPQHQLKRVSQHHGPVNAWRADLSPNFRNWQTWWTNKADRNGHSFKGGKYCARVQLGIYCHLDQNCPFLHSCGFCRSTPHSDGYLGCPVFATFK